MFIDSYIVTNSLLVKSYTLSFTLRIFFFPTTATLSLPALGSLRSMHPTKETGDVFEVRSNNTYSCLLFKLFSSLCSILIKAKGALDSLGTVFSPQKAFLGYGFACDGPVTFYFHFKNLCDWDIKSSLFLTLQSNSEVIGKS